MYYVADIETILEPISTVLPDPKKLSTTKVANHVPCSASYMPVFIDTQYFQPPKVFKGENCVTRFLDSLKADVKFYKDCFSRTIKLLMSDEDETWFQSETLYHIC